MDFISSATILDSVLALTANSLDHKVKQVFCDIWNLNNTLKFFGNIAYYHEGLIMLGPPITVCLTLAWIVTLTGYVMTITSATRGQ